VVLKAANPDNDWDCSPKNPGFQAFKKFPNPFFISTLTTSFQSFQDRQSAVLKAANPDNDWVCGLKNPGFQAFKKSQDPFLISTLTTNLEPLCHSQPPTTSS
jgi:hypothetical protein